ncbi:MAG: ABC transporter permease [Cyclobacteriaceae bacterium]|nr:ABC transporter permease [Cyclobacteriaceae bacterium]
MINNYLKISYRNLVKQRFYSLINIAGLSIGLCCTILIALFVADELSYDRHHEKAGRIYRVATHLRFGGNDSHLAVCPAPFAEALMSEIPEVEVATRFRNWGTFLVKREAENFNENRVIWADPQVFRVFTIPLLSGDTGTVLTEPNTMAVSESVARKFFGEEDPLNQTLILNNHMNYKITGVYRNIPKNSHFHFDILLAMTGLDQSMDQLWLSNNFHTYFVMRPDADPEEVEGKINEMFISHAGPQVQDIMGKTYEQLMSEGVKAEMYLQALPDIHLKSDIDEEFEANGDIRYVYLFTAIALFILILAIVNFMNLATARSADRAREVGIRKVLGSLRSYIVRQFLTESVLVTAISILLAIVLTSTILPYFNRLAGKSIVMPFWDPVFWGFILVSGLLVGFLAGIYPAFFLSSFKPVTILQGKLSKGSRSSLLRSVLVVFQFSISIILIIGTAAVYNQLNFIQNKKLGFNKDQVIILEDTYVLGNQINAFRDELVRDPRILSGTVSSFLPVTNSARSNTTFWKEADKTLENSVNMQRWNVDHDYMKTMGLELVIGRFFSHEFPSDSGAVVLNERAAKQFGFDDPVGEEIYTFKFHPDNSVKEDEYERFRIVGVVKDFHFESIRENIGALSMMLSPSTGRISFKFDASEVSQVINLIQTQWKNMAPGEPLNYTFLDEDFGRMYQAEKKTGQLFSVFAVLAVIIASLGLFALAAFMAEQRTKEIGVRKVMGATMGNIMFLLSKDFGKLVIIAFLISVPVAWYGIRAWLQGFAYKDIPGVILYMGAGLVALVLAWLTVSYQSYRAASANPAQSLRDE